MLFSINTELGNRHDGTKQRLTTVCFGCLDVLLNLQATVIATLKDALKVVLSALKQIGLDRRPDARKGRRSVQQGVGFGYRSQRCFFFAPLCQ